MTVLSKMRTFPETLYLTLLTLAVRSSTASEGEETLALAHHRSSSCPAAFGTTYHRYGLSGTTRARPTTMRLAWWRYKIGSTHKPCLKRPLRSIAQCHHCTPPLTTSFDGRSLPLTVRSHPQPTEYNVPQTHSQPRAHIPTISLFDDDEPFIPYTNDAVLESDPHHDSADVAKLIGEFHLPAPSLLLSLATTSFRIISILARSCTSI